MLPACHNSPPFFSGFAVRSWNQSAHCKKVLPYGLTDGSHRTFPPRKTAHIHKRIHPPPLLQMSHIHQYFLNLRQFSSVKVPLSQSRRYVSLSFYHNSFRLTEDYLCNPLRISHTFSLLFVRLHLLHPYPTLIQ